MKNLPVERTKYRLWHQLVDNYITWIWVQETTITIWKVSVELDLMMARWAYRNYRIIEPFERFIQ